jgi:predicted nucleotidyltransferase
MKTVEQIRTAIRQHQDVLVERFGVRVVGIFGSYVRGGHRKRSDVDLLADIVRPISLLELIGAELYLSEVLGVKVDLIPKRDVREELRENIFREALSI